MSSISLVTPQSLFAEVLSSSSSGVSAYELHVFTLFQCVGRFQVFPPCFFPTFDSNFCTAPFLTDGKNYLISPSLFSIVPNVREFVLCFVIFLLNVDEIFSEVYSFSK